MVSERVYIDCLRNFGKLTILGVQVMGLQVKVLTYLVAVVLLNCRYQESSGFGSSPAC